MKLTHTTVGVLQGKDLTGQRFHLLTVRKFAGRDKSRCLYWECECDCGNMVTVRAAKLRSGRQVSCGCMRADPGERRRARMKVSPERRREIAKLGATQTRHKQDGHGGE
jgi:hypothetical protein